MRHKLFTGLTVVLVGGALLVAGLVAFSVAVNATSAVIYAVIS